MLPVAGLTDQVMVSPEGRFRTENCLVPEGATVAVAGLTLGVGDASRVRLAVPSTAERVIVLRRDGYSGLGRDVARRRVYAARRDAPQRGAHVPGGGDAGRQVLNGKMLGSRRRQGGCRRTHAGRGRCIHSQAGSPQHGERVIVLRRHSDGLLRRHVAECSVTGRSPRCFQRKWS